MIERKRIRAADRALRAQRFAVCKQEAPQHLGRDRLIGVVARREEQLAVAAADLERVDGAAIRPSVSARGCRRTEIRAAAAEGVPPAAAT